MAAVPLGPFVRFVLAGSAAVYQNWDTIQGLFDRHDMAHTEPIYGQYVQHRFQMKDSSGTFTDKESGICGVHWINTTGGDLDVTWTSADFALIESGFQTFWSSFTSFISGEFQFVEHRWYPFGPGVLPPNPPVRITTLGSPIVGTGTNKDTHQLCTTFTMRTPLRRHWGRIYMPVYGAAALAAGGQLGNSNVDSFCTAFSTYLKSGTANGLSPVIWDRARKSALGVTAVEVDSVHDIQRRRRPRASRYKKILTS